MLLTNDFCFYYCLFDILEKPVETIQKPFANFNASFFVFHVRYLVHTFFITQKLLLLQLIVGFSYHRWSNMLEPIWIDIELLLAFTNEMIVLRLTAKLLHQAGY